MDEFIDQLLREDRVTDIQLPRLQVDPEQIQLCGRVQSNITIFFVDFTETPCYGGK